jgi:hypothetical protein
MWIEATEATSEHLVISSYVRLERPLDAENINKQLFDSSLFQTS